MVTNIFKLNPGCFGVVLREKQSSSFCVWFICFLLGTCYLQKMLGIKTYGDPKKWLLLPFSVSILLRASILIKSGETLRWKYYFPFPKATWPHNSAGPQPDQVRENAGNEISNVLWNAKNFSWLLFFFFLEPLLYNITSLSRDCYFSFLAVPAGQRTCTCRGWLMAKVPVCNHSDRGWDRAVILFLGKERNVSGGIHC